MKRFFRRLACLPKSVFYRTMAWYQYKVDFMIRIMLIWIIMLSAGFYFCDQLGMFETFNNQTKSAIAAIVTIVVLKYGLFFLAAIIEISISTWFECSTFENSRKRLSL